MKHLKIELNNIPEIVNSSVIHKLYEATLSIPEPEEGEEDTAYLSGNLLTTKSYRNECDYLTNRFLDLNIVSTSGYYMIFEDPEVLRILSENYGDGVGITDLEAANIIIGRNTFYNSNIVKFNEFLYFTKTLDIIFAWCKNLINITLPNSITSIEGSMFYECSNLSSIIIPNSVTSIKSLAFYECSKLTSVTIPSSVTSIDRSSFFSCNSLSAVHISDIKAWCQIDMEYNANPLMYAKHLFLEEDEITDLIIPDGVTTIKKYTFYNCYGLTSVTIPSSVTSIGRDAFYSCINLKKVIVSDIAAWCNIEFFDYLTKITNHIYSDKDTEITDLIIPDGVTTIKGYAFYNCYGLTSVTIPSSVTSIGSSAFYQCYLESLYISDLTAWCNIEFINLDSNPLYSPHGEPNLYLNGNKIENLVIPNNITTIKNYTFAGFSGTSITIPSSVTSIGNGSFYGCGRSITSISIPNSVTSIGGFAFYGCTGLISVTIPNSVTSIGNWAFSYCSGLTSITISDSVTIIESFICFNCGNLTSIMVGNNVSNINESAFNGCPKLTSFIINTIVPPTIGSSIFYNTTDKNLSIYVPAQSVDAYKTATGWSDFASKIYAIEE